MKSSSFSHIKPKPTRYETSQGATSLQDLLKLRKRASLVSSLQFFNPKSQDLNYFTNFASLKRTFRSISKVTISDKLLQKLSPLLFQIKPQKAIKLFFDGPKETNQSRSSAKPSLNTKNLMIFLSRQRPSQVKQLQFVYNPSEDLNIGLQKTIKSISLFVNLEDLKITLRKHSPGQLKLSSQTAKYFCKKLSYLKALKKFLIKGLWLAESDHLKFLSTLKKLPNLEQYSFRYDPLEIQLRSPETMHKLQNDFVLALEALEAHQKIIEVAVSIKSLYKGHEQAVYEALNKYLQRKTASIKTLYLDLSFFEFPKETFRICGQLSEIQDFSIKFSSGYQVSASDLANGLNCIANIQNGEIQSLTLDFSEMNLLGFDEILNKSLVRILTSLKSLHEFGLRFAKVTPSICSIWNKTFRELYETELPIKTLKIDLEFDDERNITNQVFFDFLEALSSQRSLENFYFNISLNFQSQRRGVERADKEKVIKTAINLVLTKLGCLSFLKKLKVAFEKGFTHMKFQDLLRLKSLRDLACIPKLWIAWENNVITEYNLVCN